MKRFLYSRWNPPPTAIVHLRAYRGRVEAGFNAVVLYAENRPHGKLDLGWWRAQKSGGSGDPGPLKPSHAVWLLGYLAYRYLGSMRRSIRLVRFFSTSGKPDSGHVLRGMGTRKAGNEAC